MAAKDEKETNCIEVKESVNAEVVPVHSKQVAVSPKRDVVKSTAVIKWSATQFPVQFSKLSMNTNLNDAPANWLRSESREEQHLRDLPWQRHRSECSSFAMANCYPDYAGEVDVVSDAENIKRLLKITYENSHASLMVHRVGRTLLLDNFDIHKHLLRQESENWTWLRQFFKDTVMKNEEELKYVPRPMKTQAALQKQLMFSKFLYYSIIEKEGQDVEVSQVDRHHQVTPAPTSSPVVQHFVADRAPAIGKVQCCEDAKFHRQTLWTFEDLRMLIGTDLPVFSVGDHPCVSLRLRDAAQPINVVTGLDYWLDNLMCNVPEVAMCFHDSGFVQKYELIKTEDIPKLESCKFSPETVKYVATNILSFLRNSATKEGHTYWLYKCKQSNLVKLYDLTTLCGNSVPNKGVTPFTIPVAMLLYRVARKLRLKSNYIRHIPQIKALLQTSLQLLEEIEHAEVCTSSLYLLSDLYIPDSCLRNVWVDDSLEDALSEQSSEEEEEEEREEEDRAETSVSVKELLKVPKGNLHAVRRTRLEGITGTPDERCKDGLKCLRRGLGCLDTDLQAKVQQSEHRSSSIVEEQMTCNASEAIPLKYEPIHQMELSANTKVLVQRSRMLSEAVGESWHTLTKCLLLRKASMANYVLATEFLSNKQYGCSLRQVRYAIHCFESMVSLKPSKKSENSFLLMLLLLTTSEVRHHLATGGNFEEQERGYNDMSEEDTFILDSAQSVLSVPEMAWVYKWTTNRSENLQIALQCLDSIRELGRQQSQTLAVRELLQDVTKKTSAICNELGKIAMAQAESIMNSAGSTFEDMENEWKQSLGMFERGVEGFHKVKDAKNEAALWLNIVRLHKIAAQAFIAVMENTSQEFSTLERHQFEEAFECYRKALHCLDTGHKQMHNNILWDYSSTYLTLGMYLQRYPPRSANMAKVHQEVADLYRKAIKKCQQIVVEAEEELWRCCKDRVATLEYNLAELYISSYNNQTTHGRQQKVFAQAEGSFRRAADLFQLAGKHYKFLQLQCKRLALHNIHYSSNEDCTQALDVMLKLIMDCEHPLQEAASSGFLDNDREKLNAECRDPNTLLEYLLRPMLIVLKHLLKRATRLNKGEEQEQLRDLYKKSLEMQNQFKDVNLTVERKYMDMCQLLAYIKQHYVCDS